MNEIENEVVDSISEASHWLVTHQGLLIQYAVNVAVAVLILFFGAMLSRILSKALNRVMQVKGVDNTVTQFLTTIIRYTIFIFAIVVAMTQVGIQTTSLIAILGAAGLAVGLALQGSLSNFAAGVLLVLFRPFRAGEYVDLGGIDGTVKEIQIFSTTLTTADGRIIVVPNSRIISNNIINFTREPNRRIQIIVGVAYDADIDLVKRVLTEVIEADPRVIKELGITVRLNEMAASSLNFVTRAWTTNGNYWDSYFDLQENFKRALDRNNIGIPYPQMDVHLYQQRSDKA